MDITSVIECVALQPGRETELAKFFSELGDGGDLSFFHPHATDEVSLRNLAENVGKDIYYLFVARRTVIAYGLLRGWNEGYSVPSLGIAVSQGARGMGVGNLAMSWLEAIAQLRGASAVRLRVHKTNALARKMYVRRGYRMTEDETDMRLLVGVKSLDGNNK